MLKEALRKLSSGPFLAKTIGVELGRSYVSSIISSE